jgi:mono/diheme cytochrome c family protein
MKGRFVCRMVAVGIVFAGMCQARTVFAQPEVGGASGSAIFGTYCAACHGTSAKGDGPLASSLKTPPANLTLIASRNGGTFSSDQVSRIIDGRSPVKGHGGGDMPVWGDAFGKSNDAMPVTEKIRRLVVYLESIQAKP